MNKTTTRSGQSNEMIKVKANWLIRTIVVIKTLHVNMSMEMYQNMSL